MPLLFPFDLDWNGPFIERRAFDTSIFEAGNGAEQRRLNRRRARRSYRFGVFGEGADAARLEASLVGVRNADVAIPVWPYERNLTAEAALGAGSLSVDTTESTFLAGGLALLVESPSVAELVTIDTVAGASLALIGVTGRAWPAGSRIVPCVTGRLAESHRFLRIAPDLPTVEVDALADPMQFPVSTGVLGAVPAVVPWGRPMNDRDPEDELLAGVDRLDSETAGFSERLRWANPGTAETVVLNFDAAADALEFWAWYESVLGALTPFWVPSWHDALSLAAAVAAIDSAITIDACGYTEHLFPREMYRHLGFESGEHTVVHRRVTAAVDNGNGTETLTLDAAVGAALTPGLQMVTRLRLMRLAEDLVEMVWEDPDGARVELRVVELPLEAPASV